MERDKRRKALAMLKSEGSSRRYHSAYREEACLGLGLDLALALALASSDAFRASLAAARSAVTLYSADT